MQQNKHLSNMQKAKIIVPIVLMSAASGTLPALAQASVDPAIAQATANSGAVLDSMDGDVGKLKTLLGGLIFIALVVTGVLAGHRLWKKMQSAAG